MRADGWWMDGDEAALVGVVLAPFASRIRRLWTTNGVPVPQVVDVLLGNFAAAAAAHVAQQHNRDASASNSLPSLSNPGSYSAPSSWLSCRTASTQLGISPRAVAEVCKSGALRATRAGEGRGVAWAIDPGSVAEYADERARRGRGEGGQHC